MKTFHSSGTPIGIADRMPRWKQTITNAAIAVGQPPWEKNSASGISISMAVLMCASRCESRPGRRSSGNFSKNARLRTRGRITGLLDIIVEMTNGKCRVSLEVAAPIQIAMQTSLAARMMSTPANRNAHREAAVHLAAGGQEDHLVAQSGQRQQHQDRRRSATSAADPRRCRGPGSGPVPFENSATSSMTTSAP